eukprot:1626258-Rhodomonas_salina.2
MARAAHAEVRPTSHAETRTHARVHRHSTLLQSRSHSPTPTNLQHYIQTKPSFARLYLPPFRRADICGSRAGAGLFGSAKEKKHFFCATHRQPFHIDRVHKTCVEEGCGRRALFGNSSSGATLPRMHSSSGTNLPRMRRH